jgi:hypothetical protein
MTAFQPSPSRSYAVRLPVWDDADGVLTTIIC